MFSVEERDALRDRVLGLAEEDARVVAGAAVGSLAVDAGDRYSDLDLTFGVAAACMERGRVWQGEHYIGAVRDHALSLACLREGQRADQARGYDDLSAETLARFEDVHVGALEPDALQIALAASVRELVREGFDARLPHADVVAQRLAALSG